MAASSAGTAISLAMGVPTALGGKGSGARSRCGWQRQKVLDVCEFWTAVDKQPELSTPLLAPHMHRPREPIKTLTDLPKWEAKG